MDGSTDMLIFQFVRFSNANKIFALTAVTFHVHKKIRQKCHSAWPRSDGKHMFCSVCCKFELGVVNGREENVFMVFSWLNLACRRTDWFSTDFFKEKKKGHASKEKRGVIEHLEVTQRCDSIEYILVFLLLVKTM